MSADDVTAAHRFRVSRDEEDPRVWLGEWVDDGRVHTFGRSLAELEHFARDALGLWLHVDPEDIEIELDVDVPGSLCEELAELRRQRDELEVQQATVLHRQRSLAARLVHDEGMTYRDAARFLGISHQRIAQLLKRGARTPGSEATAGDARGP